MTPAQQIAALEERIIEAALAECRQRYEDDELASRVHHVCDDASEAQRLTDIRIRLVRRCDDCHPFQRLRCGGGCWLRGKRDAMV